jgi:DNA primase
MISDDKKEEIRAAADIVEVVGDYVKLKKSGSGFTGLCPFHTEKTPSFHVTPRLGIYKCFGCGESGDVFSFVMKMDGISFPESLKTLAERYGIDIPDEFSEGDDEHTRLREGTLHVLKFAGLFFYRQLMESDEASAARTYLESRGYPKDIWRSFGLGYAPGGSMLLKAAQNEGISEDYLREADLIKPSQRNDGYFDTFRDRLMFPIFNPSGKVIAFAGRILADKKKTAKYINSAQTAVYNKSEVVYGVNFAKNEIRKEEEVLLVEGYTDVITMNQYDIKNVVASSGTSLTSGQIRILQRYGNRIVMIYDADSAGQTAMERGLNVALEQGMNVHLMELPEGEDPDSFVKQFGKESFLDYKKKRAEDFVSFLLHKAEKQGRMEGPAERAEMIKKILESIALIPGELDRQFYVQHLHQKTQIYRRGSDRELFQQLDVILNERKKQDRFRKPIPSVSTQYSGAKREHPVMPDGSILGEKSQKAQPKKKRPEYELEIIRLLIQYGQGMRQFIGQNIGEDHFEDELIRDFYSDIMSRHIGEKEISVDVYMNRGGNFAVLLGDILLERHTVSEGLAKRTGGEFRKDKNPVRTAKSTLRTIQLRYCERKWDEIYQKMKSAQGEEKLRLTQLQQNLKKEMNRIKNMTADELYDDPDDSKNKPEMGSKIFEYKMKKEKE